jgi:hypothetical protein
MSKYKSPVMVSSKKEEDPVTLHYIKMHHTFTLALTLFSSRVTCGFSFPPNPTIVPIESHTDMEGHLI